MGRAERWLYRVLNVAVRLLLRSPLHGVLGGRILLLSVVGRRSGRTLTVPVGYLRDGENILVFTGAGWSAWWKNLRGGAPVKARLRGKLLRGSARAQTGGVAAAEGLRRFLSAFPGTARRYGVGLDAEGRPDPRDVDVTVGEGKAVMIVLEPEVLRVT